jgi:hypothetical protein
MFVQDIGTAELWLYYKIKAFAIVKLHSSTVSCSVDYGLKYMEFISSY